MQDGKKQWSVASDQWSVGKDGRVEDEGSGRLIAPTIVDCMAQGGLRHTECAYYYLVRRGLGDPTPTV